MTVTAMVSAPEWMPRRAIALIVICVGHLAVIWALAHAFAVRRDLLQPPAIETHIIDAVRPKPPPPPPPSPVAVHLRERPALQLPLPEVRIALPAEIPTPAPAAAAVASVGHAATGGGELRRHTATEMEILSVPNTDGYYPPLSRDLREEGGVITRVCVRADDTIASVQIVRSSGRGRLDTAALAVAQQTHWKVATSDGKPVSACENFAVNFKLGH